MLSCVLHQLRMGVDKAHGGLEGLGGFEVDGWQVGHAGASLSTTALVIGRLPVRVARNAAYPLRAVVADREIDMVFCPNRKWASLHISISRVKLLNHVCLGHSICLDVFPGIAVFSAPHPKSSSSFPLRYPPFGVAEVVMPACPRPGCGSGT